MPVLKWRSISLSLMTFALLGGISLLYFPSRPVLSANGSAPGAVAARQAPPLGVLNPPPNLLPAGTVNVTLSLSTTAPSNCRWSDKPNTLYNTMPHEFLQGQGTTQHSTLINDLHNLDDRWFYVRCRDLATGRNPDNYERQTHLRVLGPWPGGYPRLASLWSNLEAEAGAQLLAGYDLFLPYQLPNAAKTTAEIRALNPNTKILLTQNATYGWPELDPLTNEWWNSNPGDPGYNCLLRDSEADILLVSYWGHPMYNMTIPYCRTRLAQQNISAFLSTEPDQGANLAYDGIYWDLLYGTISWLGDDIDSDLDGQPDDLNSLNAAYLAGMKDFLSQVRARLPHIILAGNESPQLLAPWINGRLIEWQLSEVLEGSPSLTWDGIIYDYRDWTGRGQTPRTTFIQTEPEAFYDEKYPFQQSNPIPAAMKAEAAASYQRMRYGLTSALMGNGLFSYDLRPVDGPLWWYDEFGALSKGQGTTLPPRGYLGQPTGAPALLIDSLKTPDQLINGNFKAGLAGWEWWVDSSAGAAATLDLDTGGGVSGAAAHIVVTRTADPWSVMLYQPGIATVAGQSYTLSFWARSEMTHTLYARVTQISSGDGYGFDVQALVTPQWQHFHLWDEVDVTANDGELDFHLGESVGEFWLDNLQFQAGALGVWARPFSQGLAVINTTRQAQTVPLPGVYCKLNGSQAPLFQARVDDNEAQVSSRWSQKTASAAQFGPTIQKAPAGTNATVTYTPALAYPGAYEVLAWVAPAGNQSRAVSVTIRHTKGEATVWLDQTAGQVGWRSLGTYTFEAGQKGEVILAATGNGTVVADAVKWVSKARYNDGSQVKQVTLQPLDGLILLSSCPVLKKQLYLPLVMGN